MSLSSTVTEWINAIESWIEARHRPLLLCPLRFLCACLIFVALMLSNLVAVMRWPFSALLRIANSRRTTMLGKPIHANEKALLEIFEQDLPVVVDFFAEWCGPCLLMNSVLSEFAKAEESRVIVAKVDATLHPRLTSKHKVGGLPTILLFQGGEEIGRHVGPMSLEQLQRFVEDGIRDDGQ
jgi:thioredoxin 1